MARGVDYIEKLPGCESPVEWYGQFSQLVAARDEQAEERGRIDLIIALEMDQACRLVGRQELDAMEDTRLRVQTQFVKRLILVSAIDTYELIPPEADDEATQKMLDQVKRKDIMQLERQAMGFCRKVEISHHHAENRKVEVRGSVLYTTAGAEFMRQLSPFWLA